MAAPAFPTQIDPPVLQELLLRADRAAVVGSVARGLGHELRNPLQSLMLVARPEGGSFEDEERIFGAIQRATEVLAQAVTRFGQVHAPIHHPTAPVVPDETITEVYELQQLQRGLPAPDVALRLGHHVPAVRASEGNLRHALLSLIINAKEALAERSDGVVTLATRATDGMVEIVVDDNGPGIPPDDRERVFLPFYTTKPRAEGLGLGLTVARRLVESWGGSLGAGESESGGASMVIRLRAWKSGETS